MTLDKYILRTITYTWPILVFLVISSTAYSQNNPILKIGLIADPQYQDIPAAGERQYRESLWKLKEAIDTLNYYNVDMIQNLGDIINAEWQSYDSIMPVYQCVKQGTPSYHVLGNHDFSVDSSQMKNILTTLSMPDYYYSYESKGWRFIALDATDVSYFSNVLHHYDTEVIDALYKKTKGKENQYNWNSGIGVKQIAWLKSELKDAELKNQKVIIYSHMPIRPKASTNLWNNKEISQIIEKNMNVVAFISGHRHEGGYAYKKGVHYIGISGMVNTSMSSYGILEIYNNRLVLNGYGNQEDLILSYD